MKDHAFKEHIQLIKERNDIMEVIGEHVPLNKERKACCPFHKEKNPSFTVRPEGQYFHCFGCGAAGDVVTFIMLFKDVPFQEAVKLLAERTGLQPPNLSSEDLEKMRQEHIREDIITSTALFYHHSLIPEAEDYLTAQREITRDTINKYLIGYAKGGLKDRLTKNRIHSLADCLAAGVLRNRDGGGIHDHFYHRITFPVFMRERVVSITGRSFPNGEPKYLNLPGSPIVLYNQNGLHHKEVFIVEGVFDCLMALQHGFNAVALQGAKNFKKEYLSLFQKAERVYACLDGDEAGREGMRKIGSLLEDRARLISLPDGKDLDDFLKEDGAERFHERIASSLDPLVYEISLIPKDTERIDLLVKLESIIPRIAKRDSFSQETLLKDYIQKRFKLRDIQIDGIRKQIRAEAQADTSKTPRSETQMEYRAIFPELVDLVDHEGQTAYLVKEGDEFISIRTEISIDSITCLPPPKKKLFHMLPDGERVKQHLKDPRETDNKLFSDIVERLKEVAILSEEGYYQLLALWVLHTYLQKCFEYSPQICFYSLPGRGKTRMGKALIYASYRGIFTSEIREAINLRMSNNLNAAYFFDLWNVWKTAQKTESVDLLLQRFQRGSKSARVLCPDRKPFEDYESFDLFGPTVYATNEPSREVMESRGIVITMPFSDKIFNEDIKEENFLPYRERLVAFRGRHLSGVLPDCVKPSPGRLGDIMRPLYQILKLVCPEREEGFLKFVDHLEEERRMTKSETKEARVLEAMREFDPEFEGGELEFSKIADKINEGRPDQYHVSNETIGRILKAMNLSKRRGAHGKRYVRYDGEKIRSLCLEHGV